MGRIRTIKPETPQSETLGRVSRDARLLFLYMWTIADDAGRLRGNSRFLANTLFPYDEDVINEIDAWIEELLSVGCIRRYAAEGNTFIDIPHWQKHQKIDRPTASKLPDFERSSAATRYTIDEDSETTRRAIDEGSRLARVKDQDQDQYLEGKGKITGRYLQEGPPPENSEIPEQRAVKKKSGRQKATGEILKSLSAQELQAQTPAELAKIARSKLYDEPTRSMARLTAERAAFAESEGSTGFAKVATHV